MYRPEESEGRKDDHTENEDCHDGGMVRSTSLIT